MASVLVGIDDRSIGEELVACLEQAGHQVTWVGALDVGPASRPGRTPHVLIVDGDAPGMDVAVVSAAWGRLDPAPSLVVLAATAKARIAGERSRATVIAKPAPPQVVTDEVTRVAFAPRGIPPPTAASALRVLGLAAGGLPEDEAATILAGSRHVDAQVVREALRPHIHEYVIQTPLLAHLGERRAIMPAEAQLCGALDGSRTVKGLIDAGLLPALAAARLVWALVSGGAAKLLHEPPSDADRPRARATAAARDHLRARRARVARATHYEVLEVPSDASPADLERAAQRLAVRFAPEAFTAYDLGDLAPLVEELWTQILRARQTLIDVRQRQAYNTSLGIFPGDPATLRLHVDEADAEAAFVRGQRALGGGDAFKAVSELAAAARRLPEEPDYEAYAAWARVCADEARGRDRLAAAQRERAIAEEALVGRKPRPRALFALGLLCQAAGDVEAAKEALRDALACDPRFAHARQLLARLGG